MSKSKNNGNNQKKETTMDTTNAEVRLLEEQLAQAKRDAEPCVTEVLKDDNDAKVTKISHGGNVTLRTDIKTVEKYVKPIFAQ